MGTTRKHLAALTKLIEAALPELERVHRVVTAAADRASSPRHSADLADAADALRHWIEYLNVEYRLGPRGWFVKRLMAMGAIVGASIKTAGKGALEGAGLLALLQGVETMESIMTQIDASVDLAIDAEKRTTAGDATRTGDLKTETATARIEVSGTARGEARSGSFSRGTVVEPTQDVDIASRVATARAEVPSRVQNATAAREVVTAKADVPSPTVVGQGESDQALPVTASKDIEINVTDALGITDDASSESTTDVPTTGLLTGGATATADQTVAVPPAELGLEGVTPSTATTDDDTSTGDEEVTVQDGTARPETIRTSLNMPPVTTTVGQDDASQDLTQTISLPTIDSTTTLNPPTLEVDSATIGHTADNVTLEVDDEDVSDS